MRARRPQPATVVAIVALIVALSGTSLAAVSGGSSAPRVAPASCPPQTTPVGGLCFDSAPSGPVAGVKAAADGCAVAGGYLPTVAELAAARGELRLGDGRGAHSQFTDSYFSADGASTAMTTVLSEGGSRPVADEDLESGEILAFYQYTCVYRPGG